MEAFQLLAKTMDHDESGPDISKARDEWRKRVHT